MRRRLPLAAALTALALAGCGYGFTQRYAATGGVERIHVRPFVNLSTEPELGAAITTTLRTELARRGADAPEGEGAVLEGEIRATEPAVTAGAGTTWRVAVEIRARLVPAGGSPVERTIRRETDYLGGALSPTGVPEPLETEGRRALALRRVVDDAARELLRAFER